MLQRLSKISSLLLMLLAVFGLAALVLVLEKPTGTAQGVVSGEDGRPLADAQVSFEAYPVSRKAHSDAQGIFHIDQLPVGNYYVSVHRKGYQPLYLQEHKIGEGQILDLGKVALKELAPNLSVTVWNSTKTPEEKITFSISGAKVRQIHFEAYKIDLLGFLAGDKKLEDLEKRDAEPSEWAGSRMVKSWDETIPEDEIPEFDRKVRADFDGIGLYVIHTTASSLDRQKVFVDNILMNKTDLGFVTKRDDDRMLVYVSKLLQPQTVAGAQLWFYPQSGRPRQAETDAFGVGELNLKDWSDAGSGGILVVAVSGDSLAYAYAPVPESNDEAEAEGEEEGGEGESEDQAAEAPQDHLRPQVFLFTERPLYRPAQKVYFKGILRLQDSAGKYQEPPPGKVDVSVQDPKDNILWEGQLPSNANGSFWGDVDLPEEAELGYYKLKATFHGKEFSQDFDVDEYRKPEFKVEIRPDKLRYFAGDKIRFLIDTQYYFGAPVEADISYTLYKSAYYYSPPEEALLSDIGEEAGIGGYGDYVEEGKGRTDRQGHLQVEVKSEAAEQDQRYTLRVTAVDITNRTVTTENDALVTAGDFYFRTEHREFLAFPKKPFDLTVVTRDYDAKPVARPFQVRLEREVWDPIASEYDYKKEGTVSGETAANGEGKVSLDFPRGGDYRLVVSGKDRAGRKVLYYDYLWASGTAEDSEDFGLRRELKVVTDKKKYEAGETAKIFLVGPIKGGRVLVTVEGPTILQHQVVTLDGFSKLVEIPLKKEWTPNVFVSAVSIGKKEYYESSVELAISPKEHYLNVEIQPDAQLYRPAGNITYTITTKDMQGNPVPAELSLGVVDESLYALRADSTDIKKFFWGPRPNRVASNYSFSGYYTGGIAKEDRNLLRRNFKDTAYWAPALQTGANGQIGATFTLPDNLTTWRATVLATTNDTSVGQQIDKVIASKDLIARIATPRFFTERDQVTLKAILHNYTDKAQTLRVSLGLEGLDFAQPKDGEATNITIQPKDVASFDFTVLPKLAGMAKVQLLAKNGEVSDGVELKIPVLPHGLEDHQYAQGEVSGGIEAAPGQAQVPLTVAPQTDPQRARLKLTLDTSFLAQLLGSLSYLIDYPYGCVEQTMSRLLPALTVQRLYQTLGLSDPMLAKKLPKVIAKGLRRILRYQHPDGGWGWWKEDQTDPYMTAYALYGLIRAEQLGEKLDADAIQKGKEALGKLMQEGPDPNRYYMFGPEATLYYLHYVASLAGIKNNPPIPRGQGFTNRLSEALLILALEAQGKKTDADYWVNDLRKTAQCSDDQCWLPELRDGPFLQASAAEVTAWGLQALLSANLEDANLKDSLVRWLLLQRRGGAWRDTRETATALYALADYAKGQPGVKAGVKAMLQLNGQPLEKVAVAASHFVRNVVQPALKTGDNKLGITNLLATPLYYQTDLESFTQEENLAPVAKGIRIRREYLRLDENGTDAAGARVYKVSEIKGKVKKGEILGVRLTVESDQDLSYVVLEDPFPSGFEVVEEVRFDPKADYYADYEKRDEKIAFFANFLKAGPHVYDYALRPELAGSYHVMPTQASEMYQPEVRGSGAEARLDVE